MANETFMGDQGSAHHRRADADRGRQARTGNIRVRLVARWALHHVRRRGPCDRESDLWVAPVSTHEDARVFLDSTFIETHGRFAPRAPWLAYVSNETGQLEVYVDRFPDLGAKRLVSTKGGRWPRWASDGRELFYISPENQLMAVAITGTPDRLGIGVPRPLFAVRPRPPVRLDAYPLRRLARRPAFLVDALVEDTASTAITLALNWADGLTNR